MPGQRMTAAEVRVFSQVERQLAQRRQERGEAIRKRREALGWSLAQTAARAGVLATEVALVEEGVETPTWVLVLDSVERSLTKGEER